MTTIAPELLESLSTWEELSDCARMVAQDMDSGRWSLGDLTARVQVKYGQDSVGQFAAEVGVAKAQTLRDYARVARRFEFAVRNAYADSHLTFSHFRTAMRAGDDAELFLARAADDGLTVAALAREIARAKGERVPPRKVFDGAGVIGETADGLLYIVPDGDCGELAAGLRVVVKVWTEAADG